MTLNIHGSANPWNGIHLGPYHESYANRSMSARCTRRAPLGRSRRIDRVRIYGGEFKATRAADRSGSESKQPARSDRGFSESLVRSSARGSNLESDLAG